MGRPRTRKQFYNHSDALSGDFDEALDRLVETMQDVGRVGAQAMAQVVVSAAKRNAPVSLKAHMFYGENQKYGPYQPGSLKNAIYQVYSKDQSINGRSEYHVSWNYNKVPYGFMVEFGTSSAPAHPFLYPAYAENKSRLVAVANAAMSAKLKGSV